MTTTTTYRIRKNAQGQYVAFKSGRAIGIFTGRVAAFDWLREHFDADDVMAYSTHFTARGKDDCAVRVTR